MIFDETLAALGAAHLCRRYLPENMIDAYVPWLVQRAGDGTLDRRLAKILMSAALESPPRDYLPIDLNRPPDPKPPTMSLSDFAAAFL